MNILNILTDKRCFCTLSPRDWWWLIGQDWTRLQRSVGRTRRPAPSCAPGQRKSKFWSRIFLPNAEKACTLAAKIDTMRSLGRPPRLKDLSKIFWKFVEWCDLFDFKVNVYVFSESKFNSKSSHGMKEKLHAEWEDYVYKHILWWNHEGKGDFWYVF